MIKSFARHRWLSRKLFGGTIKREWKTLQELWHAGFKAAPQAYACLENYTLVMEFVEGEQLLSPKHYAKENLPERRFFEQLRECVKHSQQLGFAHGDFRRANLLIRPNGEPCIIDWATATFHPPKWRLLLRTIHHQQRRSDRFSLIKLLDDYHPDLVTPEERRRAQPGSFLRFARFLRYHLYRHGIKEWLGRAHHGGSRKDK